MSISNKDLHRITRRHWIEDWKNRPYDCPPGARVVTGEPQKDAYLHYLITDCGVELRFDPANSTLSIKEYVIHDEKKFMWFVLRWS
jgi:hypothetical protein